MADAPLTPAEELWLWRKARGLVGTDAAGLLGLGHLAYWARETGATPLELAILRRIRAYNERHPPTPALLLELAQRRSGKTVAATAKALGISRQRLWTLVRRGDERIFEYWRSKGFTLV